MTKHNTNGGTQYCGLGEPAGGNTLSPNCYHRSREGARYTNDFTQTAGMHSPFPLTILE